MRSLVATYCTNTTVAECLPIPKISTSPPGTLACRNVSHPNGGAILRFRAHSKRASRKPRGIQEVAGSGTAAAAKPRCIARQRVGYSVHGVGDGSSKL